MLFSKAYYLLAGTLQWFIPRCGLVFPNKSILRLVYPPGSHLDQEHKMRLYWIVGRLGAIPQGQMGERLLVDI